MSTENSTLERTSVQKLAPRDLQAMLALQHEVTLGLPVGFVRPKTEQELMAYVDGRWGAAYGIFEAGTLSAMALLRVPDSMQPNQGMPFPKVHPADWPLHAAFLENALVAPHALGRGHQRALVDARLAHASVAGMRWVCAGVHLGNVASWSNLLARGMVMVGSRREDGGYSLVALLKALDASALPLDASDQQEVPMHHVFAHQDLLQSGYAGVRLTSQGMVVYQRCLQPV